MAATRNRRRSSSLPPAPAGRSAGVRSPVRSRRSLPASLVVLRAFLGVTFVYAGVQKLLDPNFLRAGSPDYIGTQLHGFAQGSPIGWLLGALAHVPVLTGIGIAVAEILIGAGTLAGVAPRAMAAAGFLVNLTLLLSATWHVHPYFLGSDSIYAVAWAAYLAGLVERSRHAAVALGTRAERARHAAGSTIGRRELLRGATLAGATLATTAVARALSGSPASASLAADRPSATASPTRGSGSGSGGGGADASGSGSAAATVQGTPVAQLSTIPVGGAIGFQAPGVGPAALVRLSQNDVVAYSRVCTHAGCLVGYDPNQQVLYCPCHGAEYDPANGAAVIGGPAPRPLEEIPVRIDRATGEVLAE